MELRTVENPGMAPLDALWSELRSSGGCSLQFDLPIHRNGAQGSKSYKTADGYKVEAERVWIFYKGQNRDREVWNVTDPVGNDLGTCDTMRNGRILVGFHRAMRNVARQTGSVVWG